MRVGIVGLPQCGKTAVFNALTGAHGDMGVYHAAERLSLGVVSVPDDRLDALAQMLSPKETVAATIEFEDIGGVFSHLAGGERSGQAVAALRDCDAMAMVVRCFEAPSVFEILGEVDPLREYNALNQELLLADLEVIEKRLDAIERDVRKPVPERDALKQEQVVLEQCRLAVEQEEGLRAVQMTGPEQKMLRSYAFLTLKPRLCILNVGEGQVASPPVPDEFKGLDPPPVPMCAKLEMELMDLEEEDRAAFLADGGLMEMASGKVIRASYDVLGLRSFFTHVSDKLRAWTIQGGTDAKGAAGKIHTDMEKGFIRAEVVGFADLAEAGSIKEARARGKVRMEGKDYEVRDGDVITFHFSR
ncbi:MAG: redox-regulated ATPase YchF [Candidatus Brocadiae bacterium]|nr:redox-regulated ATPase YchF [Candidatus Brocadiia bacterium]